MKILLLLLCLSYFISAESCAIETTQQTVSTTFVDSIKTIIADTSVTRTKKIVHINAILAKVEIHQVNKTVAASDTIITAKITYESNPVQSVRVCGKNVEQWKFKPSRSNKSGMVNITIVSQGSREITDTHFMIIDLYKSEFFKENKILFESMRLHF